MNQLFKAQNMINDLSDAIDRQADKIIDELKGQKIKDVKQFLKSNQFELNPTKRKLANVLEEKLSSIVDEQLLLFEADVLNS